MTVRAGMSEVEVRLHITPAELHEFFCEIFSKYKIVFLVKDSNEYRIRYEISLHKIMKMSGH